MTLVWLLGGLALLVLGGEFFVRGAAIIALRAGLSPLFVGLTVVAAGTSAPELVVSLRAAVTGADGVAVGNVIGSNICNIGLILGLSALIRPLAADHQLVRWDVPIMIGASLLVAALLVGGTLSRPEALLLLAAFAVYQVFSYRAAARDTDASLDGLPSPRRPIAVPLALLAAGLPSLMLGGGLFVRGAEQLARAMGVSEAVIGLSVVAVGTSLPELATSLVAAVRRHNDIAIGNVIGSNIFNALAILGTTAAVAPLATGGVTWVDLTVMLIAATILLPIARSHAAVTRLEGALLLTGYLGYLAWLGAA